MRWQLSGKSIAASNIKNARVKSKMQELKVHIFSFLKTLLDLVWIRFRMEPES